MKDLRIEATYKTPLVELNRNGQMLMKGRSIPENGYFFYQPIFQWIEEYGMRPSTKTTLDINLEYINTISSKCILDVLKGLENIKKKGFDLKVYWYYKEDVVEILEAGQDYQIIIYLDFSFIAEP